MHCHHFGRLFKACGSAFTEPLCHVCLLLYFVNDFDDDDCNNGGSDSECSKPSVTNDKDTDMESGF